MSKTIFTELTIMFVDVAGSVALYEKLGDGQAHRLIVDYQQELSKLVEQHHGRVIETIGDEIMCTFDYADDAVKAATLIQNTGLRKKQALQVRIGLHSGKTGIEFEHPYGDTVNVAARMVALAEAGQIIVSKDAVSCLAAENNYFIRKHDHVFVKGKSKPFDTFEILGNQEDATIMFSCVNNKDKRASISCVRITYCENHWIVDESSGTIVIGRSDDVDITVLSKAASRRHVNLQCRGGSAILEDISTNGTMLITNAGRRSSDGLQRFLHRDQCYLSGSGVMSLGKTIQKGDPFLINFECLISKK